MIFMMRPSDLGELYGLLTMYKQAYGGIEDRILSDVADNYKKAAGLLCHNRKEGEIPPVTNPRAAGRKARKSTEIIQNIRRLRNEGMTIRSIASETGCSVGYVHKLIHEHDIKTG